MNGRSGTYPPFPCAWRMTVHGTKPPPNSAQSVPFQETPTPPGRAFPHVDPDEHAAFRFHSVEQNHFAHNAFTPASQIRNFFF